jgi:hypothetical protein
LGKDSIELSLKHGVNPCIPKCFFCNRDKNEILLFGKMKPLKDVDGYVLDHDPEAPRGMVLDKEPCDECGALMGRGIILVSVRDGEQGNNPYRTGGWVVAKDDLVERMVTTKELADRILKSRFAFIPDEVWDVVGLPRGPIETAPW